MLRFEGPWHSSEELAHDDLLTIRAAARPSMTRTVKLQAMEHQADFLKDEAKRDSGGLHRKENQFRGRVKYIDTGGTIRTIQGPLRHNEGRAQADLEAMRKAAAGKAEQAEQLEAMSKEAHRLQEHAVYEAQIAMALGKDLSLIHI